MDGADIVSQKAKASAAVVKDASVGVGHKVSSATRSVAAEATVIGGKTVDKLGSGLNLLKTAVNRPAPRDGSTKEPTSES